jgi:type III secretion protein V
MKRAWSGTVVPEAVSLWIVGGVVAAMLLPISPWLLDVLLAANLAVSFSILVAALWTREVLDAAPFPGLLMLTALVRLALNVSSLRLSLSEGHAGRVIEAFGDVVMRGDPVVGAVIFAVLVIVQLLVVAKGAERVAEVSARFALDAMPGKQMSIDADVRGGALTPAEAQLRRAILEREAQLFGAMDGAMKFVKGDALVGILVLVVNVVGGTAVGTLREGLPVGEALSAFALLAVGDGLASLLPSLCITVAAGLVVTRVGGEGARRSVGAQFLEHFTAAPASLGWSGAFCAAVGLLPGMPFPPFAAMAALCGIGAAWSGRSASREPGVTQEPQETTPPDPEGAARFSVLTLDLGRGLEAWGHARGPLQEQALPELRTRLELDLGVPLPPVLVRMGAGYLAPGGYALLLEGVPLCRGQVETTGLYVSAAPSDLSLLGISARPAANPATGQPAGHVDESMEAVVGTAGLHARTPAHWMVEHLYVVLRRRTASLLGVQEVQSMLDGLELDAPVLVREALRKIPLPLLVDVLRRLLSEEVSIRNLRAILEALLSPMAEGDGAALAERCRAALRAQLSYHAAPSGSLFAWLVDPNVEQQLRRTDGALAPDWVGALLEEVRRAGGQGKTVLLVSPEIRRPLRRLCEGAFPDVSILTWAELDPSLQVRPLGRLGAGISALAGV